MVTFLFCILLFLAHAAVPDITLSTTVYGASSSDFEAKIDIIAQTYATALSLKTDGIACTVVIEACMNDPDGLLAAGGTTCAAMFAGAANGDCDFTMANGAPFSEFCPYTCDVCCGDDADGYFATAAEAGMPVSCTAALSFGCGAVIETANAGLATVMGITGLNLSVGDICPASCDLCEVRRNLASRKLQQMPATCLADQMDMCATVAGIAMGIAADGTCGTVTFAQINPAAESPLAEMLVADQCMDSCNACCDKVDAACADFDVMGGLVPNAQAANQAGTPPTYCDGLAADLLTSYTGDADAILADVCPYQCLKTVEYKLDGCCTDDINDILPNFNNDCPTMFSAVDGNCDYVTPMGIPVKELCPETCGYCVNIAEVDFTADIMCAVTSDPDGVAFFDDAAITEVNEMFAEGFFTEYMELESVVEVPSTEQSVTIRVRYAGYDDSTCDYEQVIADTLGFVSPTAVDSAAVDQFVNGGVLDCTDDPTGSVATLSGGMTCEQVMPLVASDDCNYVGEVPGLGVVPGWYMCQEYCNACGCGTDDAGDAAFANLPTPTNCAGFVAAQVGQGNDCEMKMSAINPTAPPSLILRDLCPQACGCMATSNVISYLITTDYPEEIKNYIGQNVFRNDMNDLLDDACSYVTDVEVTATIVVQDIIYVIDEPVAPTYPPDTQLNIDETEGACEQQCVQDWHYGMKMAFEYETARNTQYAGLNYLNCYDAWYDFVFVGGINSKEIFIGDNPNKPRLYDYCCDQMESTDYCLDDMNRLYSIAFSISPPGTTMEQVMGAATCSFLYSNLQLSSCASALPTGDIFGDVCCEYCAGLPTPADLDATTVLTITADGSAYDGYVFYEDFTIAVVGELLYAYCDVDNTYNTGAKFPDPTIPIPSCTTYDGSTLSCSGCEPALAEGALCLDNNVMVQMLFGNLGVEADTCTDGIPQTIESAGVGCSFYIPSPTNPQYVSDLCCAFCCASCARSWNPYYIKQHVVGLNTLVSSGASEAAVSAAFFADDATFSNGASSSMWDYYSARSDITFTDITAYSCADSIDVNTDQPESIVTQDWMVLATVVSTLGGEEVTEYTKMTWNTVNVEYYAYATDQVVSNIPIPVSDYCSGTGLDIPSESERTCSSNSDCTDVNFSRCSDNKCEPCYMDEHCSHMPDETLQGCFEGECVDLCPYSREPIPRCGATEILPIAQSNTDCYDLGATLHFLPPEEVCSDCFFDAMVNNPGLVNDLIEVNEFVCLVAGIQLEIQMLKCTVPSTNNTLSDRYFCRESENCQCEEGQGHCIDDTDCADGLVCMPGAGRMFGFGYYEVAACVQPENVAKCAHSITKSLLDDSIDEDNWTAFEMSPSDDFQEKLNNILVVCLILLLIMVTVVLSLVHTGTCSSGEGPKKESPFDAVTNDGL